MAPNRIQETFQRLHDQGRAGLIPFLTVGMPDIDGTLRLVPALVQAGADIVELGVPFSDPLADGATNQRADFHALKQGVTLHRCLEVSATLRERRVEVPLVLMGYYNPILTMGVDAYAKRAAEAGVDGSIVVDLPPEECGPLLAACRATGVHLIPLLAPTSTDERIARACDMASGFIYCVSLTGVTGARDQISSRAFDLVRRVRQHTPLPIAIGFGLSRREHILAVGEHADAAIVGGALLDIIAAAPAEQMVQRAQGFIAELSGNAHPVARGAV